MVAGSIGSCRNRPPDRGLDYSGCGRRSCCRTTPKLAFCRTGHWRSWEEIEAEVALREIRGCPRTACATRMRWKPKRSLMEPSRGELRDAWVTGSLTSVDPTMIWWAKTRSLSPKRRPPRVRYRNNVVSATIAPELAPLRGGSQAGKPFPHSEKRPQPYFSLFQSITGSTPPGGAIVPAAPPRSGPFFEWRRKSAHTVFRYNRQCTASGRLPAAERLARGLRAASSINQINQRIDGASGGVRPPRVMGREPGSSFGAGLLEGGDSEASNEEAFPGETRTSARVWPALSGFAGCCPGCE